MRYRPKQIVEAWQCGNDPTPPWVHAATMAIANNGTKLIQLTSLGNFIRRVFPGEWVIQDEDSNLSVMSNEQFHLTFEPLLSE